MTEAHHKTETFDKAHRHFGGEIEIKDFNTTLPNKNRINKLADAINLHKTLKENLERRKELNKYKNMTLEELREMKLISNTNGRPTSTLTDEKWQKEFVVRKLFIHPYSKHVKKMDGKFSKESGKWNFDMQGEYYGTTNYQDYCRYINDVLSQIRSGQVDYCYYLYQILDLLKFHYDDLRTKYCDGYWEVWLER